MRVLYLRTLSTMYYMTPLPIPSIVPVAGVSFRQGALRSCVEGDFVTIAAVSDNPHDPQACTVTSSSGELLGFLPKNLAARLRLREGECWTGVITSVLRGDTWGLRLKITARREVALDTPLSVNPETTSSGGVGRDMRSVWSTGKKRVRAISGRDLGVLLSLDAERVTVDCDGSVMTYPVRIVTIEG